MARKAGDPAGDLPHGRRWALQQRGERGRVAAAQRPQVTRQGVVAAGVALFGDLSVQHGGVAHIGDEPIVQVGLERIQHAGPHPAGQQRIDAAGAEVAAHRLVVQIQSAGDRPHRQALIAQRVGSAVPLSGVLVPRRVRPVQHDRFHRVAWVWVWVWAAVRGRDGGLGQAGVVRGHQPLHVFAQVVPQVPAVGDLYRTGRTATSAVGVGAGVVPADHLHAGVGA